MTSREAWQEVNDTCIKPRQYRRRYDIDAGRWRDVVEAVRRVRFNELPQRISAVVPNGLVEVRSDDDDLCISVAEGGVNHSVCGQANAIRVTQEGARFLEVWTPLTRVAPEPK